MDGIAKEASRQFVEEAREAHIEAVRRRAMHDTAIRSKYPLRYHVESLFGGHWFYVGQASTPEEAAAGLRFTQTNSPAATLRIRDTQDDRCPWCDRAAADKHLCAC